MTISKLRIIRKIQHKKLEIHGNDDIKAEDIPQNTTILTISENPKINIGVLPNSITHLDLVFYNQTLDIGVLPNSLAHFTFAGNSKINIGVLPSSLKYFIYNGTQKIDIGVLPDGLRQLTFGYNYNKKIDLGVLPNSLIHLTFRGFFDQPLMIDGHSILPNDLKFLKFEFMPKFETYYKCFPYDTQIFCERYDKHDWKYIGSTNIKKHIDMLKILDEFLPLPIAEEIIPNVDIRYMIKQ